MLTLPEVLRSLAERLQLPGARVAGGAGLQHGQVAGAVGDPGAPGPGRWELPSGND